MGTAGFVLAGGLSSRMGRDKALLESEGMTLLERVAGTVLEAAGSVAVVAPAGRYEHLALPIAAEQEPGRGPLGGIHAALLASQAEWSLIVACDLPDVTAGFLRELLVEARTAGADACVPLGNPGRPEPLCAVYRATCCAVFGEALRQGRRRVQDALGLVRTHFWQVSQNQLFRNVNRPEDWLQAKHV